MFEEARSSASRRVLDRPRSHLLVVLAVFYALVLQLGLGGLVGAGRLAAAAGFPAEIMLCQPGEMAPMPADPAGEHDRHGDTCCLAACAARLLAGPLPSTGLELAPPVALIAGLRAVPPDLGRPARPALHPLSARGPPLQA